MFVRAKGDGAPVIADSFRVVVLADQTPASYEKQLRPSLGFAWAVVEPIHLTAEGHAHVGN